jgi:hypothetical protein
VNGLKRVTIRLVSIILAISLVLLASFSGWGEDWVIYQGSGALAENGAALRDWYTLNWLAPEPRSGASAHHYYDRDSVASNSPFPGGTVRVWEKFAFQRESPTYKEAKEELERLERARLNRTLSVFDMARLFPVAVNRATKEVTTYYEINCDTNEFFILEVNTYDKTGHRMTREVISDKYLWSTIKSETVMEALSRIVCQQ